MRIKICRKEAKESRLWLNLCVLNEDDKLEESRSALIQELIEFLKIFFEAASALGTVGLSSGITWYLAPASKAVLIGLMFIGRLGPLTILLLLNKEESSTKIEYAEEKILVG